MSKKPTITCNLFSLILILVTGCEKEKIIYKNDSNELPSEGHISFTVNSTRDNTTYSKSFEFETYKNYFDSYIGKIDTENDLISVKRYSKDLQNYIGFNIYIMNDSMVKISRISYDIAFLNNNRIIHEVQSSQEVNITNFVYDSQNHRFTAEFNYNLKSSRVKELIIEGKVNVHLFEYQ
jgi:hypothetical protein